MAADHKPEKRKVYSATQPICQCGCYMLIVASERLVGDGGPTPAPGTVRAQCGNTKWCPYGAVVSTIAIPQCEVLTGERPLVIGDQKW